MFLLNITSLCSINLTKPVKVQFKATDPDKNDTFTFDILRFPAHGKLAIFLEIIYHIHLTLPSSLIISRTGLEIKRVCTVQTTVR